MKDPAFLFYTNDFLSGVSELTMEERGQYITLMCLQHQKGALSPKLIKINVPNISPDVLCKFSKNKNGDLYNKRLRLEIEKRKKHSEKQSLRAKKGWEKRKATADATASPLENEDRDVIEDEVIDSLYPSFEDFWKLYDKKTGKPKCEKKWSALTQKTKEEIMIYIPKYKEAQPDKSFRKDPITFFNNESWNDEIIKRTKQSSPQEIPENDFRDKKLGL